MNANEDVRPRAGRRRLWVFAPIMISLAALVVAGVVLTRRDDDPGYQGMPVELPPQPDLHFTMDPLPDGWVAAGGADMVPMGLTYDWMLIGNFDMTAYGTSDDPMQPAIVLAVGDEMAAAATDVNSGATVVVRIERNGVVGLCGLDEFGLQRCLVTKDGRHVLSHSRGFTDEQLVAALVAVTIEHGVPAVPAAALPAGTALLASWHNQSPGPLSAIHEGAVGAVMTFAGTDGKATLTVGRADQQELALAFASGAPMAREVDGITYYVAEVVHDAVRHVVWEHDGLAFQMVILGAADLDPVHLARSLRPATAGEWTAALGTTAPRMQLPPQEQVSDTTWPPPVTDGPDAASIVDVPIETRVEVLPDGGGLLLHAALPGGPDVPLTVLKTDDTLATSLDGDRFVVTGIAGATLPLIETVDSAKWSGAYVLTTDARATTLLMVRTNGDRYVVPLVTVPGSGGARAAYVAVPAGERWNVEVDDQFGTALDFMGQSVL